MSRTQVFSGITIAGLSRLREEDSDDYDLDLDPGRVGGTVNKSTPFGDVVVRFDHDSQRAEMTVTIVKKPALLPSALLWAGVSRALRRSPG